jgi:hypothetical protein
MFRIFSEACSRKAENPQNTKIEFFASTYTDVLAGLPQNMLVYSNLLRTNDLKG